MSTASSGYIIVEVVSARRISAPLHSDYEYQASIQVGDQTFVTQPAKISTNSFAGQTLTWRDRLVIRLNSSYDARRGLTILISSLCGKVQFGAASCGQPREWFQLSKPRGEVQVIFHQQWERDVTSGSSSSSSSSMLRRPQSAGAPRRGLNLSREKLTSSASPINSTPASSSAAATSRVPPRTIASVPQTGSSSARLNAGSKGGNTTVGVVSALRSGGGGGLRGEVSSGGVRRPTTAGSSVISMTPTSTTKRAPYQYSVPQQRETGHDYSLQTRGSSDGGGVSVAADRPRSPVLQASCSTINILSVEVCNLAVQLQTEDSCMFVTIWFANQEQTTSSKRLPFTRTGFSGCFADKILQYDVPVTQTQYFGRVQLWEGQSKFDGRLISEGSISLQPATERPDVLTITVKMNDHPGASLLVSVQGIVQQPLREGRYGRPMSAFTRSPSSKGNDQSSGSQEASARLNLNETQTPASVTFHPDVRTPDKRRGGGNQPIGGGASDQEDEGVIIDDDGSSMDEAEQDDPDRVPCHRVKSQSGGNHQTPAAQMAEEAQVQKTLEHVASVLTNSLETALAPVLARISKLETRIKQNEENVMQLLKAQHSVEVATSHRCQAAVSHAGVPPLPRTMKGQPPPGTNSARGENGGSVKHHSSTSRPSSAASCDSSVVPTSSFGSSKLPVTNEELAERFAEYDVFETGCITKAQLFHFYRSASAFASDESEDEIEEKLKNQVGRSLDDQEQLSFDDFCKVALRLAKA